MWNKLGFEVKAGKHVTATLKVDGAIVVHTMRSHGDGKLDGQIPHFIRQKMFLNDSEFADAYQCPMNAAAYIEILKAKGKLRTAQ